MNSRSSGTARWSTPRNTYARVEGSTIPAREKARSTSAGDSGCIAASPNAALMPSVSCRSLGGTPPPAWLLAEQLDQHRVMLAGPPRQALVPHLGGGQRTRALDGGKEAEPLRVLGTCDPRHLVGVSKDDRVDRVTGGSKHLRRGQIVEERILPGHPGGRCVVGRDRQTLRAGPTVPPTPAAPPTGRRTPAAGPP